MLSFFFKLLLSTFLLILFYFNLLLRLLLFHSTFKSHLPFVLLSLLTFPFNHSFSLSLPTANSHITFKSLYIFLSLTISTLSYFFYFSILIFFVLFLLFQIPCLQFFFYFSHSTRVHSKSLHWRQFIQHRPTNEYCPPVMSAMFYTCFVVANTNLISYNYN